MPAKMARSAPRSAFGPPERPVSVGTSRLSCEKAVKRQYSPPVRASSEESPFNRIGQESCPKSPIGRSLNLMRSDQSGKQTCEYIVIQTDRLILRSFAR